MINVPTLYDACKDASTSHLLYVWIFTLYTCLQLVGSFVFGIWMDRRPITEILLSSAIVLGTGNVLYTHGVAQKESVLLLLGRGIAGLGSSILVAGFGRSFIPTFHSQRERLEKAEITRGYPRIKEPPNAHVTRYSEADSRESRVIWHKLK